MQIKQFNDDRLNNFKLNWDNLQEFKALVKQIEQEEKDRLAKMIAKDSTDINLNLYSNISLS